MSRPFIAALTLTVTTICALSITTTVESNLSFVRQLDRLLALPGSSESKEWDNPQHALVQDVREDALVQNFNSSNSAVLRGQINETPSEVPEPTLVDTTTTTSDSDTEVETPGEEVIETIEEPIEAAVPEEEPAVLEVDSVSDTPLEAMSKGFFKFVDRATKLLPFAQESIVEPVETIESAPEENEESPEAVPVSEEVEMDGEVVNSDESPESPSEEVTETEPSDVSDEYDSVPDTDDSGADSENEESEDSEQVPAPEELIEEEPDNWITFKDFGLPPLNSGQFIRNVQLRVSLGGTLNTVPEVFPALAVEYNTGDGWTGAGTVLLDGEISNALNGGYYLFALPTFKNVSDLDNLEIRISYEGDYTDLGRLYIDSAWLEIDTETFTREMLNQRIHPDKFSGFKLPDMYEYIGTAIDFTREELPQFTLKYESQRNPVVGFFRNLFGRPLVEVEQVSFELPSGLTIPVEPTVELTSEGLLTIQLTDEDKAKLQPGKYEVEITVNEGGKEYTDSFNFQWGVLAINTDQTTYTQGATTTVMLGALSEDGNTLCEAHLQLYIFDPEGYIFDAPVMQSGLCNGNNVVDTPDYSAVFHPTVPGTYEMYVEHIGQNGEVLAHAYDTFIVEDAAPLTIEREGPTRINPRFEYPMTLTVKARDAFVGELIERVPHDFTVMNTGAIITVLEDGTQELRWDLDLAAGEEVSFVYNFDAPDISPWLYNLGPASITDDAETLVVYETVPNSTYLAQESVVEESAGETPVEELVEEEENVVTSETETSTSPEEVANETPEEVAETTSDDAPVPESSESITDLPETENLPFEEDDVIEDEIPETETSTAEVAATFIEHRQWQIASDATGSALLYWDGATIPSGWTCVSCAPAGSFYQRFVMGSSTAGVNGGATTHTHTMSSAVTATGATGVSSTGGGGADAAQNGHTHTYTPTIGTGSNLPNYRNLVLIQHNSAGSPTSIPTGAIALFDASVPTGWTQYAAQNGAFPRAEATSTVTTTGGSATHTHAITGTTGVPNSTTNAPGTTGSAVATQAHTHTINGASSAGSSLPPYIGAIFGKLNATSSPTDAMIMMWTDEPPAGWNTVSSTSEPFANRFAVASTTYGVTGGADTHSHANFSIVTGGPSATVNRTAAGTADASGAHTHTVNFTSVSTNNQLPPYRTAVFAKRSPGGAIPDAPTIHIPFDNERTGTSTLTFDFTGNDLDGSDTLVYQVEWDDDGDIANGPLGSRTSDVETGCSPNCFINTVNGGDTNPFNDNERIRFTATSSMTSGTTYYYRVRTKETIGNTWSAWSTVRSVTYDSSLTVSEWHQTQGSQFDRGILNGVSTTTDTAYLNATTTAIPTIESSNSGNVTGSATLTLTKPTGVEAGDLLLIIVGNDDDTAPAQWDNATFKPSGFTLINEAGNTTSDSHAAAFYRVADGTESNSTSTTAESADDYWGFYIRVSGASSTNPINATGGDYNGGSLTTHNVTALTTTLANTLAFYVLSGDGGDTYPYSVGGSWTEGGEEQAGTGGTNAAGTWGTRAMAGAGSTGSAAVTMTAADSASGFQFAINPGSPRGTIMSQEVPFTAAPSQLNWGEIEWNTTEPVGSNTRFRVYYSNVSACDTQVPNGVLPGNDIGFTSSQSPLHIDSLATTTYDALCLHMTFDPGTSVQAPVLEDWTVRWVQTPQFAQKDYQWYANTDALTPTDAWPVGGDDLGENASIDAENVVRLGDILRLRMSLAASTTDADSDSASFKLQYTATTSCAAVGDASWYDVGSIGSTTAPWRGYNNPAVADATTLSSTLLSNSDHVETYEEQNNSYPNPTAIDEGEVGEWDWVIQHNGAQAGTTYCFRMARTSGEALKGYENYPTLITNYAPNASIMYRPFANEKIASTSPWFEFVNDDAEGEEVDYQIQIDDDPNFGSTFVDTNSIANLNDFTNIVTPSDKSPFASAQRMRYVLPVSLSNGTTYWWRTRAIDSSGSGGYGDWSTRSSFTIDTSVAISTWFQTTETQFDTNLLEGTDATGGNLVQFAVGSTTGTTTSTEIDFDNATVGNAWGQFSFTETGSANNILYHLEYFTGSDWALIPDSALAGNAAGYDTSPVDLINLDSATYNLIRIRANFNAGTPTLLDWTIRWGERVAVPTHFSRFDSEKFSTTTPAFTFSTTDPQGEDLQYEISWSTTPTFTSSTTRNSSAHAGFTNTVSGGDTNPFNSGETIRYQIQAADALSANTTYWWRVRAKDPTGSNSFSFWSSPWSFTTATSGESVAVSTWYQTTGAQFTQGSLTNATATASAVEIGNGVIVQSFTSNTAVPGISLSLTKPTGVQPGDLLLIIVGNDDTTATAQWNNTTFKPSGFTLINESGNATPDAHAAAFYRIADGTEGVSTTTAAQSSDDYWGYYIRVTGVSTSSPVGVIGTDYIGADALTHNIPGITTTVDQSLAFYVFASDGGDTNPFSVGGSWVEGGEIEAGAGTGNASGAWGTRLMATAGATGNAAITAAGSDGATGFQFSLTPAVVAAGIVESPAIDFDDGDGPAWGSLSWNDTETGGSQILYRVEYLNDVGVWGLIPNGALAGNSAGFSTSPVNLQSLNTNTYNEIRIVATLNCNGANCPILNDWTVVWSGGFIVSGTAYEYDGIASTTSGTVAVAVNGVLQSGKTSSIVNGAWSIPNVKFFDNDVITAFVQGVADADESVAVTVYDGTPEMSGLVLQKRHLTIGSDDQETITNTHLGMYDQSQTEDIFFNVDAGIDLAMCATTGCADAGLRVLAHNIYNPGTGANVTTRDFRNDGTFVPGANTVRVSGSWDNNATTTMVGSTVIFTATSSDVTTDPWYNPAWGYRTQVTIQASEVDADLTNFPVYIDLSDLSATFFSNVTSDGGDIRVTAADGVTELPREIVSINTGTQVGEIYFKADTISASTNTSFFIYYGNGAANDYAVTDPYGRNAVWNNSYALVYHMEENPAGGAPQYIDSTGNTTGTAVNMESGDRVAGIAGNSADVDGVDEHITTTLNQSMLDSTWSLFLNTDGVQGACDGAMFSRATGVNGMNVGACGATNRIGYHWENLGATAWNWASGPIYPTDQWFMASLVITPTQATAYAHTSSGVTSGSNVQTHTSSTINGLGLGWDSFGVARSFDGTIDEARLSTVARSADWLAAEYSNLGDTSAFYVASTSQSYGSIGSTTNPHILDDADGVLDFQNVTFGETSGSATWAINNTLDVESALTVAYGTLSRGTQAIAVSGNLSTGASGFWTGIGTTTFDGIDPSTISDQNSTKQNIGRVVVNGTSKTAILGSNVLMESMYVGGDDTFDLSNSGYTATVRGSWTNTNSFLPRTGTVAFIGTTTNVISNGASNFYNLTFNGVGGAWSFVSSTLTVENDFTIATGTVTMPTATTTIAGSFLNTGGTFAHNNATIRFTSASSETVTLSGTAFTNAFYNVLFAGSGSWAFSEANATTTNAFSITQGTVTFPSSALSVGGVFAQTGGAFTHNSGTVRFTGASTSTIDINGSSFNTLQFTGTGARSFLDTSVTAAGSFLVQNGAVTLPTGTLTLGGSLINSASIIHASGTVLFNSTDGGEVINLGNSPLHAMTFNAGGGGWTITAHATTTGNVTLTSAGSFTLQSGQTLSVGGSFTNSVGGASTTWSGSTLSLESGTYSLNTKTNPGDAYGTLRVAAHTDIRMWNSTSTVYAVNSTGSLYSQDHNAVDGALYIWGDYERTSGTEYWSYATDFDGTSLSGGSERQVSVFISGGAYQVNVYTANATFTPPVGVTAVDVLVVGGGAGGGSATGFANAGAGGGGAGGVVDRQNYAVTPLSGIPITVGAGGAGGAAGNNSGSAGGSSTFGSLTALGGGGGIGGNGNGTAGGSGGGARGGTGGAGNQPGSASGGYGNKGGDGGGGAPAGAAAGGGGGAGGAGQDRAGTAGEAGGNGGIGYLSDISGASVYYAGGGGGGAAQTSNPVGQGGQGGGGNGGNNGTAPQAGAANTGGGGGGGNNAQLGAPGGSGVVIVRYSLGSKVTINGASLNMVGAAGATTTVQNQGTGAYTLTVASSTVNANRYQIRNTDANGLILTGSTTVTSLAYGNFELGVNGGSMITVSSTTINQNPALQILGMHFATSSGITTGYNVTQSGGAPSSYWWFRGLSGNRAGESYDNDTGNPGSIRWDDSQVSITVSGVVYSDDGVTPMGAPVCDGTTLNVRIVVNGSSTFSGSCNAGTGAYSIAGVQFTGDPVLTAYLNTNGGTRGVTITKTPTVSITNFNIHANRVITRHQDTAPLTILDMAVFDADNDTDIPFVAATGTLTVFPYAELHIASSTTFAPGGNVTVQGNASSSSFDGSLHIAPNAHFLGAGTSTYTFGGSFTMDAGGSFTAASSTVILNATTTGKTITTATSSQEIIFNTLQFTGVNGAWNINGNIRAENGISAENGVVSGTGNIRVMNGSFSGNGTVSMGSGTTTIERSNTFGGTTPWTFGNLVVGNGSTVGTTTPATNATTTISGRFVIATGHTFAAGGSHLDLRGTGTVFIENGVFAEATSTVRYSGTAGSNVLSTTYYDLEVMALGGSPTFIATGLGLIVSHDLMVGGATTTTFTLDTNDPAFDVNGNVRIASNGTLIGSNSAAFTVAGGWDNDGTFTGSGGTVTFDGGGTVTIAAGASSFSNVLVNGAGNYTVSEHATTTHAFSLNAVGSFTLQSGQTLAVGGTFTNAVSGGATTWTGSTLALFGNGNYTINASTTNDTYDTMRIDGSTQIRMWNSSANTYTIASTGSLYSQDHANVNGALNIYGTYQKSSGNDYWSYATDFDGTPLGGSSRQVAVSVANGGTVRYQGGGLAVIGGSGASTTIANQGSGTYALEIGGTASTTWSRFVLRNTNSTGLLFGGTPNVSNLTFGDFEVAQNGWSAMTVGGTVITQNPAKTFSNFSFATSSGVSSAYNVTATGTTVSSWRFTNNSGAIAGEAFDNDPTGDPGYLVWDNSAALITVSGNVYSDEGSTVSTACDNATPNIHLRIAGLTSYTTSCSSSTGAYSISNISFGPSDSIVVFIDGEPEKAATVTVDPVSNITNMHLYENRVIVRHENSNPISIDDLAVWDSTADADIPFTAVDGAPDTLTIPANRKLIVWTGKEFEPNGNVTVSGGGAGAAYDGTVELYAGAIFDAAGTESHSIGGSLLMGTGATFDDENSTVTFTTTGAARTIDTNDNDLYNAVFNGSGSWTITNTVFNVGNDMTITQGAVTLPSATTTIAGSLSVTGGSFNANGGIMRFTSGTSEIIRPRTSSFGTLIVDGSGSFVLNGGFATTTGDVRIVQGSFTSATGTFAIGGNFSNGGSFSHGNGTLRFTSNSSTTVTASSSDLSSVTFVGTGPYTFTNQNLTLLGTLRIESGSVALPTGTLSVGGSFLNTGGSFQSGTGTVLFNSADTGETVNPGSSPFFNATFASAGGGWTITANATTTGNFSLTAATNFTIASSTRLSVGGVFTNLVGGAATTWAGSTLSINSGTGYTINTKTAGGDAYNNLVIGSSTALRMWDSSGTITVVDTDSSLYSQDHAAASGALNIYGNYARVTGSDYWSYATDFDGAALGGSSRKVYVRLASNATTTFTGGALQIIGTGAQKTEITNQGAGTYAMRILGGTLNAYHYSFANMDAVGLALQGTTTVTSLSEGAFTLGVNGGALISLASTTLNYNAGLLVSNTSFATTSAITGYNVALTGTTLNAWTFTGHSGNLAGENFDFDGGDECGSVRWDNSLCLLTQQSGYRLRTDDGGEGVPNSEWQDLSWTKRMRVTVTNQDAVSYVNGVVALTVPYDSDMQADFDDLRFTTADGVTPLDHFIERYDASDEALVWVKVPLLATSTYTSVFMYYGNGAAGDASATSTFPFIDTFEDGNISEYSGDTGLFTAGTSFGYERSRGLDADGNETQKTTDGIYRTGVTVSRGQTLRYLQYIDTAAGSGDETCTLFGIQTPGSNNQNYAVCLELYGVDRVSISRNVSSNDTSGTILASSTISYVTGWYEVEVDWRTNNSINVSVSQNGSLVATTSATDATYSQGGVGFSFWFQNGGWDVYSSRPHMNTKPTATFGSEQVPGGASWLGGLNAPAGGVDIGENLRVRFLVENSGLPIVDTNYEIEYAAKGASPSCEAVSASSYVPVPPQSSCGSNPICMQTSSQVTNQQLTTDLLGGEGTFVSGQVIESPDNTTGDLDISTSQYTEVEYVVTPTVYVNDAAYCLRVSDEGADLDAYTHVAEFGLVFAPIISSLSLNGGNDIVLAAGATTTIHATGTVSDLNGYTDLALATTTIFRSGVGESCSPNNNNCYVAAPSQCSFTNCSGNSCDVVCSVDMYYHTDPTDIGPYAGETWRASLSVADYGGVSATATAPSIDLLTLRALAVNQGINYGALTPDSDTGTYNATTTIQNIGNDSIDLSIEGTDLTDGGSSAIPVTGQRFATSTFTYSGCVSCATLTTLGTNFKVDLSKPSTTTPAVTDDLFWGIAVPFGVAGTAHYGTNIFYAIGDF